MSNFVYFNTSKLKSKNRRMFNMKNKSRDMNKKETNNGIGFATYRSACKNPDVSFGYKRKRLRVGD